MSNLEKYPFNKSERPLLGQLVSGSDVVQDSNVAETAQAWIDEGFTDSSYLRLVHVSREGLPYDKFQIAETAFGLSKTQLSEVLQVSNRTLERIHKEKKRLNTAQTEKVLELSMLYEHGWEVFGDRSRFRAWLERPRLPLDNKTPLSLLDTNYGMRSVNTLLGRIAHGIPM